MDKKVLAFFEFIHDRQAVKLNKDKGIYPPWSTDPVFQQFRFCNVRRIDDACTQHLLQFVIRNKKLSRTEVIANIVLFRFFNTRDFFTYTPLIRLTKEGYFKNLKNLERALDKRKGAGHSLYNLAYRICSACVDKTYRPKDKHVQLLFAIRDMLKHPKLLKLINTHSVGEFYNLIQETTLFVGSFLAYQLALDAHYHEPFFDIEDFVDVGPGAIEGVEFIFGKKLPQGASIEECCMHLRDIQNDAFNELEKTRGKSWIAFNAKNPMIALSDIENCLCEYRKYYKLKNKMVTRIRRYQNGVC
jgi:hypothetical protein